MKPQLIALFLIIHFNQIHGQAFRDNFLGTYTGICDQFELGSHFINSDPVYVTASNTDTNYIYITDSIGWCAFEYVLYPDSTFANVWQPNFRYGHFYGAGDSIFIHDVFDSPWYREWFCGRLGSSIVDNLSMPFLIFLNPTDDKVTISSKHHYKELQLGFFNSLGQCIFESTFHFFEGKLEVCVPSFASGMYFLRITVDKQSYTNRLIVK